MAKLKEVEVSLGVSLDVKGVWYKPNARLVIELDERDTVEKRKAIWGQAWETVADEIERQLKEITG